MTENTKAEHYLKYLDLILEGKQVTGVIEDKEVEELLTTAKILKGTDLSKNSRIREQLRRQLIFLLKSGDKQSQNDLFEDLLKEKDDINLN